MRNFARLGSCALLLGLVTSCGGKQAPVVLVGGKTHDAGVTRPMINDAGSSEQPEDAAVSYAADGGKPPLLPPPIEHASSDDAMCDRELIAASNRMVVGRGSPTTLASYDALIWPVMEKYQVPGGAVAVTRGGELVLARGFGWADRDAHNPAHPDDLFRIGNLSDQLTMAAIVRLVEQGKLGLDDAAFDKLGTLEPLPGTTINPKLAKITVRQLLRHAGGWNQSSEAVRDPVFQSLMISAALGIPGPATTRDIIRYMLDKPLTYEPGSTYCYSNFGYAVLSAIVEQLTGMSFETYVRATVLQPSGIATMKIGQTLKADASHPEVTYYDYPGASLARSVFPESAGQMLPWPYGGFSLENLGGYGGFIGSAIDLERFLLRIDGDDAIPDLISSTSLGQVLQGPPLPICTASGGSSAASSSYWYGFAFYVNNLGNYWHAGSIPGAYSEDVIAPNGHISYVAVFNSRPEDSNAFFSEIDSALGKARAVASTWSSRDYFDQYTTFSEWQSADDFARSADDRASEGRYPARVEGRLHQGVSEYRAEFAPQHDLKVGAQRGLDCVAYRASSAAAQAAGMSLVSMQHFIDADGVTRYQATWSSDAL